MFRKAFVLSLLLVLLCVPALAAAPLGGDELAVFELVNRERSRKGLAELAWDDRAAKVARDYSKRMAREGFFSHVDPDGQSVVDRAERSRMRGWSSIGENLFACDPTDKVSSIAIRGWMRSASHRKNMLSRNWLATGIGIARSRSGKIYITQVFIDQ